MVQVAGTRQTATKARKWLMALFFTRAQRQAVPVERQDAKRAESTAAVRTCTAIVPAHFASRLIERLKIRSSRFSVHFHAGVRAPITSVSKSLIMCGERREQSEPALATAPLMRLA